MLNPVHLQTFSVVVTHGSFAMAAGHLGYTASAVSQQIAVLERDTHLLLFERGPRSVRLTPEGRAFAEYAGTFLASLDRLDDQVRALSGGEVGRLSLGSFPTAIEHLAARALTRLADALPGVELVLNEGEPDELLPKVGNRDVDLALVYEYSGCPRQWPANTVLSPLLVEDLVLLVPACHSFAERDVALSSLADETWVSTEVGTAGATCLLRLCAAAGFVPRISYRTNDYAAVRRLVGSGLGIAVVPALGCAQNDNTVRTTSLVDVRANRRVLVAHRRLGASPLVSPGLAALSSIAATFAGVPGVRLP